MEKINYRGWVITHFEHDRSTVSRQVNEEAYIDPDHKNEIFKVRAERAFVVHYTPFIKHDVVQTAKNRIDTIMGIDDALGGAE